MVHGASAIAVRVPGGAHITWSVHDEHVLEIPRWSLSLRPDAGSSAELARAHRALLDALPFRCPPTRLVAHLEIPSGAGLGSSAALGVAALRALEAAAGVTLSDEARFELVFHWERVFHGNPSGFDHATSLCEGFTIYQRGQTPPFRAQALKRPLTLVIAHVEPGASTAQMVAGVGEWARAHTDVWATLMLDAHARADALLALLDAGDWAAAGALFDENHAALQQIGVSTPALDQACEAARRAGAYGAKLIGAGGGGCVAALVDSERAAAVEAALQTHSLLAFTLALNSTPQVAAS